MTEQRIIEIFKDNVKACIKENTPISVVNNLPVEMAFVGLKEAAQQIMKELDTKEVPEYVECVKVPEGWIIKKGQIFKTASTPLGKYRIILDFGGHTVRGYEDHFKPSTKEAYEQQREWPKVGDEYFTIDLGQTDFVFSCKWDGTATEKLWKERGIIFRTREAAIEAARKILYTIK